MGDFFPDTLLDEIRLRSNMVQLVSEYVTLKKAGRNFQGLCPFHSEKTPSFTVNEEKQFFHCFGCNAGGDLFSFLMRVEQMTFPEAVKALAERAGVEVPSKSFGPEQRKEASKKEKLFEINEESCRYFQGLLEKNQTGKEVRQYLLNRGIKEDVAEKYRLGFAGPAWEGLTRHLEQRKVSLKLVGELGLCMQKQRGGFYDRFRNRLMFPIRDVRGKIIAFGGRSLDGKTPKYMNSPESALYQKGRNLYGLDAAKQAIQREGWLILVEGYFDLLAMVQHGFQNVVAALGTALTEEQVKIIRRYTDQVVTIFDADPAGVKATLRNLEPFLQAGIRAKMIVLPEDNDPASYLQAQGPENMQKRMEKAVDLMTFLIDDVVGRYFPLTPSSKARAASELLPVVAKIPDTIERYEYLREIGERLDIQEQVLFDRLTDFLRKGKTSQRKEISGNSESRKGEGDIAEEMVVSLMIHFPSLIIPQVVFDSLVEEFSSPRWQLIARAIIEDYQSKGELQLPAILNQFEDPDITAMLTRISIDNGEIAEGSVKRCYMDCNVKIKRTLMEREKKRLSMLIREAEQQHDIRKRDILLREKQDLLARVTGIRGN